jgi:hypothetical protein
MSDPIDTVTGHAAQPKSTRGATWVTAPQEIVTTSQRTALASSLTNADIGYTVIDSDLTNVAGGELSVWVFAGTTAGFIPDQIITNGAANVYGLARNLVPWTAAQGAYTATEVLGFTVSIASSADWSITPVGGSAVTTIDKATFTAGQTYPIHCSSITPGTAAEVILYIPDA